MDGSMITNDRKLIIAATRCLRKVFHYKKFTSDQQKQMILRILRREPYVYISLPYGYGRKFCYELPAAMATMNEKKWTIVLCDTSSSTETRINTLKKLGVHCSTLGDFYDHNNDDDDESYFDELFQHFQSRFLCGNPSNEPPGIFYVPVVLNYISCLIGILIHILDQQSLLAYIVVEDVPNTMKWKNMILTNIHGSLRLLKSGFPHIPWISMTDRLSKNEKLKIDPRLKDKCMHKYYDLSLVLSEEERISKKLNKIWDDLVLFEEEIEERENEIQVV